MFCNPIRHEIRFCLTRKGLKVSYKRLATLLYSYAKGKKLSKYLYTKIIIPEGFLPQETWTYSYWLNDMATGIAILKKKYPAIKALSRAHRWDVYPEQSPIHYLPLRQFLGMNLDLIITISKHGCKVLQDMISQDDKAKIQCIPLGAFGGKDFHSTIEGDVLNIVSCSYLIERKRIDKIIKALNLIDDFQISWSHIGGGDQEESLLQLAEKNLAHKKNVRYSFKGSMKNQDIINYYSTHPIDLFINTSEDEGIPVSIMEAFSFGIPAIATNVGGVYEIIDNEIDGYLISSIADETEIANSISKYYNQSLEKKQLMRKNAFVKWDLKFNAEINYRKFIEKILAL
jgi:glycosyltransferase involved in cell wall biosynthesis